MFRPLIATVCICFALNSGAQADQTIDTALDSHILPAFQALADTTTALAEAAQTDCAPANAGLRAAYHTAFDAWIAAQHLQLGPLDGSALSLALSFWPDPRGKTAKTLRRFIANEDNAVGAPDDFAKVSVAARGFTALDRMLFDETLQALGTDAYRCALTRAIAGDIARTAAVLQAAWQSDAATAFRTAGAPGNATYPTTEDAVRKLYTLLMTGLAFNAETRVARPLGTLNRPRPKRAEAWRSNRSLRNLQISTRALRDLTLILAIPAAPADQAALQTRFERLLDSMDGMDTLSLDPSASSSAWLQIELLGQETLRTRNAIDNSVGQALGLFVGFNAADGD